MLGCVLGPRGRDGRDGRRVLREGRLAASVRPGVAEDVWADGSAPALPTLLGVASRSRQKRRL
eukprot:2242596-Alexandrium_andersonii.AAC.1